MENEKGGEPQGELPYPTNSGPPGPPGPPGYPTNPPPDYASSQAAGPGGYPPIAPQAGAQPPYGGTGQTYPPPGGAQPQVIYGQPTQAVITHHVVQHFGDVPVTIQCQNCQNQVTTVVSHEPGSQAWLFFILMCLFCLWCIALIPFCMPTMQNVYHDCPVCKTRISTTVR